MYGTSPPSSRSDNNKAIKPDWIPHGKLLIHKGLFKRGLVVVTPKHTPYCGVNKDNSFYFKDRQFFFSSSTKTSSKHTKQVNQSSATAPHADYLTQATNLLSKLTQLAALKKATLDKCNDSGVILFNKRHKEEVFLPFVFVNKQQQKIGSYLYPWLVEYREDIQIPNFKIYHTAGCLFGSALKGMDQYGSIFELMKHDVKFFLGQKIKLIIHDTEDANPYEQVLFKEFENRVSLVGALSKSEEVKIIYHLPSLDYVLFGIELFIYGRITFEALDALFKEIFNKRDEHTEKIREICQKHGVEVQIESPFENLFGSLESNENITEIIMAKLKLPCRDISPDIDIKQQKENERMLVENCLLELKTNSLNPCHQQIWQDFSASDDGKISNIEGLLKVGNAAMLAVAAVDKNDYEVCSLLPLSEKQIQLGYGDCSEKYWKNNPNQSSKYAKVFNITTLDPVITYSSTTKDLPTKDLLFYFNVCSEALSDFIKKNNVLSYACENIGLFSAKVKKNENFLLEELLTEKAEIEQISITAHRGNFNKEKENEEKAEEDINTTLRIKFKTEEEAKTLQKILMRREHSQLGLSQLKPIAKISNNINNTKEVKNSNIISKIAYAIKITKSEWLKILPEYSISNQKVVCMNTSGLGQIQKPIKLEETLIKHHI